MYDSDSFPVQFASGGPAAPAVSSDGSLELPDETRICSGEREQRVTPRDFAQRLLKAGGLNRFGGANFRAIWGWTPTEYVFDRWSGGYDLRPRYMQKARNRWIIEKWHSPEHYGTPDLWRMQFTENIDGREVDLLGPFPSRGAYEQLCTIQTPEGDYMELSSEMAGKIVDLVERSRDVNAWTRRAKTFDMIEDKGTEFDRHADDVIRDLQPVFDLRPTVWLGHKNSLKGKYGA